MIDGEISVVCFEFRPSNGTLRLMSEELSRRAVVPEICVSCDHQTGRFPSLGVHVGDKKRGSQGSCPTLTIEHCQKGNHRFEFETERIRLG